MHSIAWWPTVLVVLVAVATDLRFRRIPNWLTLAYLPMGVAVSGYQHGWRGVGGSLAGAGVALALFGLLFLVGGMGGGDVKLCAAIGAWVGPSQILIALILTALVGGVMAICWALCGGFARELFSGLGRILFAWTKQGRSGEKLPTLSDARARKMPYAPAIAIGALLSFFAQ